jgi:hypothetical protein
MSPQLTPEDVTSAADRILAANSATDVDTYFGSFGPQATFLFHATPERLNSRDLYEEQWRTWVSEGWKLIGCQAAQLRSDQKTGREEEATNPVH